MRLKERLESWFKDETKRVNFLVILGVIGLAMLLVPELLPQSDPVPVQPTEQHTEYTVELEQRLEALISLVDGAGNARVMVTAATGEESVYAEDVSSSADGSTQSKQVLLGSGNAAGLVETVRTPRLQGVAVVCEGGKKAAVQLRVTEIVQALTGLGASHITVTQMTSGQGRSQ